MEISQRIRALKPSATLAISQRAAELRAAGRPVIGLSAGEPDFDTPDAIGRAGRIAIEERRTRYTAVAGILELREAICRKLRNDNDLEYAANEVLVSTGAKQSLYNALFALTEPGDSILTPTPYWVSYPAMAFLVGARTATLVTSPQQGFKITPEALQQALEEHQPRVVVFNSPCNPTGTVYSKDELLALGKVLENHSTWIITDEIYEKLTYGSEGHCSLPQVCRSLKDRCIVVNGVSKAYAMTGWRIGYAAGPAEAIAAMGRIQSHVTSNPSSIAQYAALAALSEDLPEVEVMVSAFRRRRDMVVEAFEKTPGVLMAPPEGAFYAFPDVSAHYGTEYQGSTDLCKALLEEAEVALVPGEAFGEDRCVRLSYAASDEDLREALERLHRFFARRPV